ncbi:hypothetical protein [Algibacter lectus]|uniref:hypothetical protein n=1 Tax=Algibacter lectus TaxID=221126 RepID=UPI002495291E|nr:hypothetical protein [Algibacter lectus]
MSSTLGKTYATLVEELKMTVSMMELRDGKQPDFKDYIYEILDKGAITTTDFEMKLKGYSLVWSGARLGKANWKEVYDEVMEEKPEVKVNRKTPESKSIENPYQSTAKSNQIIEFFTTLGQELDKEIIRVIKGVGIIKLLGLVAAFFIVKFLVNYFGSEEDVTKFYLFLILGLGVLITMYASDVKEGTKIFSVIKHGTFLLSTLMVIGIGFAILYGFFEFVTGAYTWIVELFN